MEETFITCLTNDNCPCIGVFSFELLCLRTLSLCFVDVENEHCLIFLFDVLKNYADE